MNRQHDHDPLIYDVAICGPETISYEGLLLLAEVHRLASATIRAAGGSVPGVGTQGWWDADPIAKLAGLAVLAESYLVADPQKAAAAMIKQASLAISTGLDWTAASQRPSHAELQRRRAA